MEGCHVRGPHSSRFCSQAMKPTRTSSETFHTWPQTTPRSSNAAAPTSGSNLPPPPPPPPACVQQMPAHVHGGVYVHIFVLATCHMLGHGSAGVDSRWSKSSKQRILCASDQSNGAEARAALREQREVSFMCNTSALPNVLNLKKVLFLMFICFFLNYSDKN